MYKISGKNHKTDMSLLNYSSLFWGTFFSQTQMMIILMMVLMIQTVFKAECASFIQSNWQFHSTEEWRLLWSFVIRTYLSCKLCSYAVICVANYSLASWFNVAAVFNMVALLAGQRTGDSQVVGLSPDWAPLSSGLGQATYTHVPLSPSSIIWYRPRGGGWSLWLGK